jgi:hypothetical protein
MRPRRSSRIAALQNTLDSSRGVSSIPGYASKTVIRLGMPSQSLSWRVRGLGMTLNVSSKQHGAVQDLVKERAENYAR